MQAIILAAGMGKRLGELTKGNTKCMVNVNGISLIDRTLTQLSKLSLRRKTSLLQIGTGRTVQYHFPLCQTFTKLLFCHVAVNLHSAILVYFLLPAHVASYHLTHSPPCVPIDKIFPFNCTTWHHIRKEVFLCNPCLFCFFVQNPIYYKNHCKRRISL